MRKKIYFTGLSDSFLVKSFRGYKIQVTGGHIEPWGRGIKFSLLEVAYWRIRRESIDKYTGRIIMFY